MNGIFEMAGAICHEFNQPLQIIKGNAELLNLDIPEDSFITQPLHDIINAVNRLGNLTRKLQLMTRYKTKDYAVRNQNSESKKLIYTKNLKKIKIKLKLKFSS